MNSEVKMQHKMLVMPLVPGSGQRYTGTGLGLHFFLGNMMAVHNELTEFWFGWRVNKIFSRKELLKKYCQGSWHNFNEVNICKEQALKYSLAGSYQEMENNINISLELNDAQMEKSYSCHLGIDVNNQFNHFYNNFFDWLAECGLPFSATQKLKAAWPEKISIKGLQLLGNAVETTYLDYIGASDSSSLQIDTGWFEKCVATSPKSYLAHDLLAWALLKNKDYDKAVDSFQTSISYNPNGLGALAGLMWCAIFTKDREEAYKYSVAKALVRDGDQEKAKAFVDKKFEV